MVIPFKSKKRVEEFILPSGDKMILSPIDGYCEDLLADEKQFKTVKHGVPGKQKKDPFSLVLQHCIEHLDSSGGKPDLKDLKNMYLGDRMYALVALRKISNGNDLIVEYTCPGCNKKLAFPVDIQEDVLDASKTKEKVYQQKGVIPEKDIKVVEVDGVKFLIKQLRTKDHEVMERRIESSGGSLTNSYLILTSVVGWYNTEKKSKTGDFEIVPLTIEDVQSMTIAHTQRLREEIDKFTIGPDVLINSYCDDCGISITAPVITPNFFKLQTRSTT